MPKIENWSVKRKVAGNQTLLGSSLQRAQAVGPKSLPDCNPSIDCLRSFSKAVELGGFDVFAEHTTTAITPGHEISHRGAVIHTQPRKETPDAVSMWFPSTCRVWAGWNLVGCWLPASPRAVNYVAEAVHASHSRCLGNEAQSTSRSNIIAPVNYPKYTLR